jgi:hypothetical protein
MPFFLSLVNFLNGCCWTAYALIKFDLYVTVSTPTSQKVPNPARLTLYIDLTVMPS